MFSTFARRTSLALALSVLAAPASAQQGLVTFRVLSPELALELAQATLAACRARDFQVAVAVVDRFGVVQVVLRDRFAGPHTPETARGKAWTAISFRTDTGDLAANSLPGMQQSGVRELPGVVAIGGGVMVQSGGSIVGGLGVSGAPAGPEDEACARAGLAAIGDKLEF